MRPHRPAAFYYQLYHTKHTQSRVQCFTVSHQFPCYWRKRMGAGLYLYNIRTVDTFIFYRDKTKTT